MISTWNISDDLKTTFARAEKEQEAIKQSAFRIASDAFIDFRQKKQNKESSALTTASIIYPFDRIYDDYFSMNPDVCVEQTEYRFALTTLDTKGQSFFMAMKLKTCAMEALRICEFLSRECPDLRRIVHKTALTLSPIVQYADETVVKLHDQLDDSWMNVTGIEDHYEAYLNLNTPLFEIHSSKIISDIPLVLLQKEKELKTILSVMEDTYANDVICKISFFNTSLQYGFFSKLQSVKGLSDVDQKTACEEFCKYTMPQIRDVADVRFLSTNCSYSIENLVEATHNRNTPYNVMTDKKPKP